MAKILIVDDSIVMRRNLKSILEEAGHTIVGESADGQQAYFDYRRTKPDIVTMDITMPKLDGIDALNNIIENYPEANIIMISALDQKTKVFSALRNGAKHYIIKPVTSEKIISVIDKVLKDKAKKDSIMQNEKKSEVVDKGFNIENIEGVFKIQLSRNLEYDDIIRLKNSLEGFIMIDGCKIELELRTFLILGQETMEKFDAIIRMIKQNNVDFKLTSRSKDFIVRLQNTDRDLESSLLDGIYTIQ